MRLGSNFAKDMRTLGGEIGMLDEQFALGKSGEATRVTLANSVADAIRNQILTGVLRDGEPIKQDDLAEELGVSRIPVREALRQLSAEGLIDLSPHRSASVKGLSQAELLERIELRLWIEPRIIKIAIQNCTASDIERADAILTEYQNCVKGDWAARASINCRFHIALYQPSGRKSTVALIEKLMRETSRYRARMLRKNGFEKATAEHAELLEQFRRRDPANGAALLKQHILRWQPALLSMRRGEQ